MWRLLPTTLAAVLLLLWNVHHSIQRRSPDFGDLPGRYFADVSVATQLFLRSEFPVAHYRVRRAAFRPSGDVAFVRYARHLEESTAAAGIRNGRPFSTISAEPLGADRVFVQRGDDSGRALLLGYAFHVLGGVAPYLIFWMAPLLVAVVLVWIAFEAARAGWAWAGQLAIVLVALSAYTTDLLPLTYSSAGFYVVSVLVLVAYVFYSARPAGCSYRGLFLRTASAALAIGLCAICRNGTLLLLPFFALAAFAALRGCPGAGLRGFGVWATGRDGARREIGVPKWVSLGVVAGAMLIGPYLALRSLSIRLVERTASTYSAEPEAQQHDMWLSLWEGLGDFDRTHGHVWDDWAAQPVAGGKLLGAPGSEKIFRHRVLTNVREDPFWYAGILLKRTAATLSQWKLLPWSPWSGRSISPSSSPNEGLIDSYYGLTSTLDWFRFGPWLFEAPLPLFWIPLALTGAWVVRARSPEARSAAFVLGVVFIATLAFPVAVTTAGALETQAIGVAYFLTMGVSFDLGRRALRRPIEAPVD